MPHILKPTVNFPTLQLMPVKTLPPSTFKQAAGTLQVTAGIATSGTNRDTTCVSYRTERRKGEHPEIPSLIRSTTGKSTHLAVL